MILENEKKNISKVNSFFRLNKLSFKEGGGKIYFSIFNLFTYTSFHINYFTYLYKETNKDTVCNLIKYKKLYFYKYSRLKIKNRQI